jgi:hypothetical protein
MRKSILFGSAAFLVGISAGAAQENNPSRTLGPQNAVEWRIYTPDMKFADVFGRSIEIHQGDKVVSDPSLSDIAKASGTFGSEALAKAALNNLLASVAPGKADCGTLAAMKLPWARIVSAENVAATKDVRAYCKVLGVIDKEINFEVDMPVSAEWNGKFMMGGNGGFLGNLQNLIKPAALYRGYATAITDTGHVAPADGGASWAYHNPERLTNFGYRATHLAAADAKLVIQAFYKKAIQVSYFFGASGSGREAMVEVERYPADFKGVVAACPGLGWTKTMAVGMAWTQQAMYPTARDQYYFKPVVPPAKVALLDAAVYAKCDAADGLKDDQITDPLACKFDPRVDLKICKAGSDGPDCFTKAQADVIAKIHAGPSNSQGQIWPGFPYGGESIPGQWTSPTGGTAYVIGSPPHKTASAMDAVGKPASSPYGSRHYLLGNETLRIVYDDPNYDLHSFNFETDVPATYALAAQIDANDPDLSGFKKAGGKLIIGQGWDDWASNALGTRDYYERVIQKMGGLGNVSGFARLFMLPGLGHCFTPDPKSKTPSEVDFIAALDQWVEKGKAPDSLIASHYSGQAASMGGSAMNMPVAGKPDRTRPICAYPAQAVYKGSGSIDDAANFSCQ